VSLAEVSFSIEIFSGLGTNHQLALEVYPDRCKSGIGQPIEHGVYRMGSYGTILKEIVFKFFVVSEGHGVGSLSEYIDGDILVYTGEALVWKED